MFTLPTPVAAGHAGGRRTGSCTSPAPTSAMPSTPAAAAKSGITSAHGPPGCRRRDANRGVAVAGDGLHGDRQRPRHRARSLDRRFALGYRARRLAQELPASSAPLPAGNLIISGVAGGEHGANGFVAAHDQATGKRSGVSTVPQRASPARSHGRARTEHGGAPTWFTGSYDPDLDVVYWPTGNPSKEYNGDHRGDNLYSDSHPRAGSEDRALKWHYQFTPHDLWDWDATETRCSSTPSGRDAAEADAARRPQRIFLVFDRERRNAAPGEAIREEPDLGKQDRRRRTSDQTPESGADACRHQGVSLQDGATNWFSPSFNPATGLTTCRRSRNAAFTRRRQGVGNGKKFPWRYAAHGARPEAGAF